MKIIYGILLVFIFPFCYGQGNKLIGKYHSNHRDEFIEIITDSLIKFNVEYPSCLAIPLDGYGEYKLKRGRLFTHTSESNKLESNTEIYFKISKDNNNEMYLIGPYFRKNCKYRKERLMLKLHNMNFLLPWKWNFKHCPIVPNKYNK